MAKRGYKLQEFVAHSANVNCLSIGKKACRLFITGGDDHKVNLWAIGKPTSLMSLCGHTSPVESVAFDSAEVLVLAGASTGAIKLWDMEEAKMVRTLTGHISNCTAVEFHPFGEFFASGSMDTNLKIWDIRKKGCIHTYNGHTRGISTIRFTPDGRWVVSGGFDNVVKVWDLTAGKLLHDFNFHEGHIRSIDFHPLEFLLATGSADRTVKFWDLETFELIGSARPEDTGVRTIAFHPDGRTLFCGFDDSLKVYSWEPVICHDTVDMGWSALVDLCINDGKLLGCSLYRNSVGVWVADASHIEPYGAGVPEQRVCTEKKFISQGSLSLEKVGSGVRSISGFRSTSPDCEMKEIKTIYVDSTGGNPIASQKVGSLNSPKDILPFDSGEISDLQTEKQSPALGVLEKSNGQALDKFHSVPSIVTQESPTGKDSPISGRESITFSRTKPGMLLRPAHVRRSSSTKYDAERLSTAVESGSFNNTQSVLDRARDPNSQTKLVSSDRAVESSEEKEPHIKSVTEKILRPAHVRRPSNIKFDAEMLSTAVESGSFNNMQSELDSARDPNSQTKLVSSDGAVKSSEEKEPHIKSVIEKILRPAHVRRPSNIKFDAEMLSTAVESGSFNNTQSELDSARDPHSQTKLVSSDGAVKSSEEKEPHIKNVTEKILRPAHVQRPSNIKFDAEMLSTAVDSGSFNNTQSELDSARDPNSQTKLVSSDGAVKSSEEKEPHIKSVTDKILRPAHVRRPSNIKFDAEMLSTAVESGSFNNTPSELDSARDPHSQTKLVSSDGAVKSSEEKEPHIKNVTEKILRPAHVQRPSNIKFDAEMLSTAVDSGSFNNTQSELDSARDPNSQTKLVSSDRAVKSSEEKEPHIKSVTEKIEKKLSPQRPPNQENCDESINCSKGTNSVKFVNGVAVVPGRTRTLVEKFERREKFSSNEDQAANITPQTSLSSNEDQSTNVIPHTRLNSNEDQATNITLHTRLNSSEDQNITPHVKINSSEDQATKTPPCMRLGCSEDQATKTPPCTKLNSSEDQATNAPRFRRLNSSEDLSTNTTPRMRVNRNEDQTTNVTPQVRLNRNVDQATTTTTRVRFKSNADQAATTTARARFKSNADQAATTTARARFKNNPPQVTTTATRLRFKNNEGQSTIITPHLIVEADESPTILKEEPQISGRDKISCNDGEVIENLMQTHDVFTRTLRSRLTKLQVVRHFWERKDIKGAINALRKLADHSVQADMISVLMEKIEILNLDLFSCLLPVLMGLLDSKMERHASISLEMLLKLVAVFGPVISSTISAPPAVGIDLHAEQRRECCNQCFVQMRKIQKILPVLVRRGGLLAKCALELNLILQDS